MGLGITRSITCGLFVVLSGCSGGSQPIEKRTSPPELAAGSERRPQPTTSTLVDIATDATDPNDLSDAEPSIAVNPLNPNEIVVATLSDYWDNPDTHAAPVWHSVDAGARWTKEWVMPAFQSGSCGPVDIAVSFDSSGHLFVSAAGEEREQENKKCNPKGTLEDHIISGTGKHTPQDWGARYGNDQPQLATTPIGAAPCAGQIYSSWLNTAHHSVVSTSHDGGKRVDDVEAGDNFPNRTTRFAISSDGIAYVLYKTEEDDGVPPFESAHFRVRHSDNCGKTWSTPAVSVHGPAAVKTWKTDSFGNPSKGLVARAFSSDGWIAVSPDNRFLYVAYVDATSGMAGIDVAQSADHGVSWTSHHLTSGKNNAGYPEIAVAAGNSVGVMYIDYDDSGPTTMFAHHFARSLDGGLTWSDETLQVIDPYKLSNAASHWLWGDFEGLTAFNDKFYGVFSGESINRKTRQFDPIFFVRSAK